MLEVEMKFPARDFSAVLSYLKGRAALEPVQRAESDHYFNAPDRDFAQTDEALRLRRVGAHNCVTYKGPKRDALTKTRTEIEVSLAQGDKAAEDFMSILRQLGYRPVAVVHKLRRIYTLEQANMHIEVCLDEVDQLGCFVELEIQATEEELDAARAQLMTTAQAMQLETSERRSYLELLLTATRTSG